MTYFLITVAVEGHTDENSTDVCTVAGTSDRKIRTNPTSGNTLQPLWSASRSLAREERCQFTDDRPLGHPRSSRCRRHR